MANVTRKELATRLARAKALPLSEAESLIEAMLAEIVGALNAGDSVELRGFGGFHVKDCPPRTAFNPRKRETVNVPARRAVRFRVSGKITQALNT